MLTFFVRCDKIEAQIIEGVYSLNKNEKRLRELVSNLASLADVEIIYKTETASTNEMAKLAPRGAAKDQIYVAEKQTAGRGRLGRSFVSDRGGLYMTLRFERRLPPTSAVKITVFAAVAVLRAIERLTQIKPMIKWVNDIFIGNKKLAGILCEGVADENGEIAVIALGIGVNVFGALAPEISEIATTLSAHTEHAPEVPALAAEIIKEIYSLKDVPFSRIMDEYRSRSLVIGREVRVLRQNEEYRALVRDIDDGGALVLEREDGREEHLATGEVSVRLD